MKALDRTHVTRNGLPPRTGYAYRGTGEDQLTGHLGTAQLAEWKPDYEQWLPSFAHGSNKARTGDACPDCGYKRGGQNCRTLCGAP